MPMNAVLETLKQVRSLWVWATICKTAPYAISPLSVCLSVCSLVYVKNSKSTTVAVSKLGCGNVIFDEATYKIDREHTKTKDYWRERKISHSMT